MTDTDKSIAWRFFIIIFAALLIQLTGRYYASHYLVIKSYFYSLWVILRIGFPVIIISLLGISFKDIGVCLPKMDKRLWILLSLFFLMMLLSFSGLYLFQDYLQSYSGSFRVGSTNVSSRLINFLIFTMSTLTGWEFLHRGFLLMGVRFVLIKEGLRDLTATQISIALVCIFEVVYHFIKPAPEALALVIGSPVLSYIAIRSRSILIPFLLHLTVELLFITVLLTARS